MGSVDDEARLEANKGLTVIIIVLTALVNLVLLAKVITAGGGLSKFLTGPRGPRYQTFISLIIGDFLVAFFSLVVRAKIIFDTEYTSSLSCRTVLLAIRYMVYIMPFVYGMGLVVLAAECILFRKRLGSVSPIQGIKNTILSLVAGAVPWVLGLSLALPLNIARLDLSGEVYYCNNYTSRSRWQAIVSICLVVPAAAALVCAFMNWKMPSPATANYEQPSLAMQQPTLTSPTPPAVSNNEQPPVCEESQVGFPKQGSCLTNPPPPVACSQAFQPGMQPQPQPQPQPLNEVAQHINPYNGQQYPFWQPANQAAHLPPGSVIYTPTGQIIIFQPPPHMRSFYSDMEKVSLLFISFLFCLCVLPFAFFMLVYVHNDDVSRLDELQEAILTDVFFWTLIARSFLMPLAWALCGTFVEPQNPQFF